MSVNRIKLGVNIDHVATLRQARGTSYPSPVDAALAAEKAGAEGITLHLREDRRHIQDEDLPGIQAVCSIPINLEMAVTEEMIKIAVAHRPEKVCLVPEKREELTTEGGLDVVAQRESVASACARLAEAGIEVSLFIDPDKEQIACAQAVGAPVIELHTGSYAEADATTQSHELQRLLDGAVYANELGLVVNAGHGLTLGNVTPICAIPYMNELNIGHALIADAVFMGLSAAVDAYIQKMRLA